MKYLVILLLCTTGAFAFPDTRIVHGHLAEEGDFPYQVAIFIFGGEGPQGMQGFKCGGSLISELHVLTAAHCFQSAQKKGLVFLGGTKYFQGQRISFSKVRIHEEYYAPENDIAVITLDSKATVDGKLVEIIPIYDKPISLNQEIYVSGFGAKKDTEDDDLLRYAVLHSVNGKTCPYVGFNNIHMVCLQGTPDHKESSCHGDSGGPGAIRENGKYFLAALVEGGARTCEQNFGNIFTRVSAYYDWIQESLKM